jgi:hypothetical protein
MNTALQVTGIVLMLLGLAHAAFPRHFRWREETVALSLLTRQILYVHTAFIGLTVFLIGLLSATCARELAGTPLGRRISVGLAVFWGIRLVVQFFGYSTDLWRGKPFETAMHILFSLFWVWLTMLFLLVAL